MSKTIEQLAKEHLKSTKSNGLAITYSLDELEDFAKAYQAQNEQQESVAVLNSIWGSDTGWQYNIKLLPSFETDKYLESIDGHDIYLYLSTPKQATPEGWLAWQARAQSPISQNEQQEVVGYIDEFGNFENSVKQWMIEEPDVKWKPLYTSPPKQIPDGWKPLSEEQIEFIALQDKFWKGGFNNDKIDWMMFAKAVVEKLCEINAAPTTSLTSETNTEVGE